MVQSVGMRIRPWVLLTLVAAGFCLGFLAHQQRLHDSARGMFAFVTGRASYCSLAAMLGAPLHSKRIEQAMIASQQESKMLAHMPDGYTQWQTPLGTLWCPPRNTPQFAVGEQMGAVYTSGKMAVGPGDIVLDCGANIGDFVSLCLKNGVTKVVAIDPSPNNVEAMRRSFASEIASGRVVIVPKGVWHEESSMKMLLYDNTLLDTFVMRDRRENQGAAPREVVLPVTTIDRIVDELHLDKVTFVKMDVEGAERNAIRGAAKTIARFRPRMALATENLPDDYLVVPEEVKKLNQSYQVECAVCRKVGAFAYLPDILYFVPE